MTRQAIGCLFVLAPLGLDFLAFWQLLPTAGLVIALVGVIPIVCGTAIVLEDC